MHRYWYTSRRAARFTNRSKSAATHSVNLGGKMVNRKSPPSSASHRPSSEASEKPTLTPTKRRPSQPSSATVTTNAAIRPWAKGLPQMSPEIGAMRSYNTGRSCKPRPSSGEEDTTGPSRSPPDLQTTADLSGLNVSHFCWLPTQVIASIT